MATLIFSLIGSAIGGPLFGLLGAVAGTVVQGALGGGGKVEGPRLIDLSVSTSSYGSSLPRHFGQMRAAGTVIWATDLAEHSSTSGGKGKPSITSYAYSASFAVALGSRRVNRIGRIWADGKLLRGAAGDLKVGGSFRFYAGLHDQAADPLISAAVGAGQCPAYRGLAYCVFENLALSNYGNRIPALSFEVIADDGALSLASLFDGVLADVDADVPLVGIGGLSNDGALGQTLAALDPVFPMDSDSGGARLTINRRRLQAAPIALTEPAVSKHNGDFGAGDGYVRKREAGRIDLPQALRYYDIDRDYQPGLQRAPGQPELGQIKVLELPAALNSADAFALIGRAARRAHWGRETLSWRSPELDATVAPGAVVTVPGKPGRWRVTSWEWRETGIELALERLFPADLVLASAGDAGAAKLALDQVIGTSQITAFELPYDGQSVDGIPAIYAAVSSASAGWNGAALFVDQGDGALNPLGPSGSRRSILGQTIGVLPPGSPMLFDRQSSVTIQLLSADLALTSANTRQLSMGVNRAMIGAEIIQFAQAAALGQGKWQLQGLLRGRGGTEGAIGSHGSAEPFVLIDDTVTALDSSLIGSNQSAMIAALGLGDANAVESLIADRGITLRPLSPVHGWARLLNNGDLQLGWTRRARGGWQWRDAVDVPLQEQAEMYDVSYGPIDAPISRWQVTTASLTVPAATLPTLNAALLHGAFSVSQRGTYATSSSLFLTNLA